jgi:hypothetical protein
MVSIDTVYQRVLALANKEQRGYITPQEFNLFANQAQMDIFEQYFYDINQFGRIPGNDKLYSDPLDILQDKLEAFHRASTLSGVDNVYGLTSLHYRTIQVLTDYGVEVEKTTYRKAQNALRSPLTAPTKSRPIYYIRNQNIYILPEAIDAADSIDGTLHYYKKPDKANWSSYILSGSELYDSTNSVDFELHPSEETKLVIKILGLAGITLKDPALYQIAGAEDNKNIQQEKQ